MITRSRHGRDGWFPMLRKHRKPKLNSPVFLDEPAFSLAVEKERCRSERRELCFCIVLFDFDGRKQNEAFARHAELAVLFRRRLRITDEIGLFGNAFAVLLPETIPMHAAKVANDLTDIAKDCRIQVSTEIFAYPEIDLDPRLANEPGNTGSVKIELDQADISDNGSFSNETNALGETNDSDDGMIASKGGIVSVKKMVVQKPQTIGKTSETITIRRLDHSVSTPVWKRAIDILGASSGLVVLSPLFLITAAMVKLNSSGPAYFTQWREGKDGKVFRIYKFRTMRTDAELEKSSILEQSEQDGPAFKIKDDPRLTGVGRYLRKTCIDELPQLINVLKGEMSLVGPRPLPVDESLNCSRWHRRRLDVLPGMTCFWQVEGGREIAFDDWMRMDLDYVRRRSLRTDTTLIIKTAVVTIMHRGSV